MSGSIEMETQDNGIYERRSSGKVTMLQNKEVKSCSATRMYHTRSNKRQGRFIKRKSKKRSDMRDVMFLGGGLSDGK